VEAGGGVHLYLEPWFILVASVDYVYSGVFDEFDGQQTFTGTAGLGFRKGNSSLEIAYSQAAQRSFGAFASLQRGPVLLTLTTVAKRRVLASLTAELIRGGGEGALAGAYFPSPRLGLMASVLAAHGELFADSAFFNPPIFTRYIGTIGVSAWRTRTAGVSAQYSFTVERIVTPQVSAFQAPSNSLEKELIHAVVLQAFVRVR
jgi:hypothetical protein